MAKTLKQQRINRFLPAFTLVELTIVVIVIGLLAGLVSLSAASIQKSSRDTARDANVKILSTALEKYYRENGEYPSVALMTSQDVATLRQKLGVVSANTFKLPLADDATKNSIVTSSPSPTRLLYSANTTNSTKNTQCQTSLTGYCDGYQLQYQKESDNSIVIAKSLHDTFTPVAGTATCAAGETQSGNTCTKTYAATYQSGTYSCPSGGTLSGTTCTSTYAASYQSSGVYTCPSGGTLSGTTCNSSTPATYTAGYYSCPSGGALSGDKCEVSATATTTYSCAHPNYDTLNQFNNCRHDRPNYTTQSGCEAAGYNWGGSNCYNMHEATATTTYSCPSGYTYNGVCYKSATYTSGYYSCPSGGTLVGTNCQSSYPATYSSGGYYCPNGGTLSGTTCSYNAATTPTCPSGWSGPTNETCTSTVGSNTKTGCPAGYTQTGSGSPFPDSITCTKTQPATYPYSCPNGGTLSGSTCSYSASYSSGGGYYYCPSGGNLSGSTCTTSYAATQDGGYYYCADGGTLSGTTCTYTYTLP
ncbi:YD repeat protein [Candidatus Saccharibacteria bacterium RAAC3_TM7_1]|nr:YD repeat protein [Candidatus Saccharibacteria bacterium RAAC3_TM7_1]